MTMQALFPMPDKNPLANRVGVPLWDFPAIAGIDLSMTNTGVALFFPTIPGDEPPGTTHLTRITSRPEDWASGPLEVLKGSKRSRPSTTWDDRRRRMSDIVQRITEAVPDGSLVFLEAPSYASSGSGTFDRSGLWWWLMSELVALECRVIPVSPAQRMMYATGKGGGANAGKDAVIAAVTRAYPELDIRDNNVADACVLMMMARRAAGVPHPAKLPAANLKALDKLESI